MFRIRKMFIDELPNKIYKNRQCINWKLSIGRVVKFIYDNIKGEIEILDYNIKTCRLNLKYLNKSFVMNSGHFVECKIGNILGIKTTDYKFEINDIVNSLTILEKIKIGKSKYKQKGYRYQCNKDGYIGEISETGLKNNIGCPICSNNMVIKGINDIATTHPQLIKYFVNIEDTYIHTYGSKKLVQIKCPLCGYIRFLGINILSRNYFRCYKCSDGMSYPEKFLFCFLEQLDIKFEAQKRFTWSNNKIYDFYIQSNNCIVETHGLQHYKTAGGIFDNYQITNKNDFNKRSFALNNGILCYIELDCKKSELNYLKHSILKSELGVLFILDNINWTLCHEKAMSSIVKHCCNVWNSGVKSVKEISKLLKLNEYTVRKYLKNGVMLNWCDYNPKYEMAKARSKKIYY